MTESGHARPHEEVHAAPHAKHRFSSLNINQRFLQQVNTVTAPKAAPTPASTATSTATSASPDHARAACPRLVTAMPGRASASTPATEAGRSKEPGARDATTTTSSSATPASTAPRMPWNARHRTAPKPVVSSHDFPTAKEAMEAERKAEERAAEEHARHQAAKEELERFRGTEIHSHDHWDEIDEESEDELDDVVEFGDGTQYKISEVEEEQSKRAPPPPRVPAWGPLHRPAALLRRSEPPVSMPAARAPASSQAPPPAPVSSWGPLAQRHSALTGKPPPKIEPPAPKVDAAEIEAEQQTEMLSAAERARRRREDDERQREAERERARQKAARLEEMMHAKEEDTEPATWRRTTPLPKSLCTPKRVEVRERAEPRKPAPKEAPPTKPATHEADPPTPPDACVVRTETTRFEQLHDEVPPVWHKYAVHLPRRRHRRHGPSRAAQQGQVPCGAYEPAPSLHTLFTAHPARVRLPKGRIARSATPVPASAFARVERVDEAAFLRRYDELAHPVDALFDDEPPRVRLPSRRASPTMPTMPLAPLLSHNLDAAAWGSSLTLPPLSVPKQSWHASLKQVWTQNDTTTPSARNSLREIPDDAETSGLSAWMAPNGSTLFPSDYSEFVLSDAW